MIRRVGMIRLMGMRGDRCLGFAVAAVLISFAASATAQVHAPRIAAATVIEYGAQVPDRGARDTALARAIGRPESLDVLVGRLAGALRMLSDYTIDDRLPSVQRVALADLRARLCGGPCTVRAAYVPGEGMFLDAELRPELNRMHQSILFHELVHHAQEENGVHAQADPCNRWRLREIEAYRLQNRFLSAMGERTQVIDPGRPCSDVAPEAQTFRMH